MNASTDQTPAIMQRPDNDQTFNHTVAHHVIFGKPGPTVVLSGERRAITELGAAIRRDRLIVQPNKPENAAEVLFAALQHLRSKDAIPSPQHITELGEHLEVAEDESSQINVQHAVQPPFTFNELNVDTTLRCLREYQRIHNKSHVCQLGILSKLDRDEQHLVYLLPTETEQKVTDTVWLFRECKTMTGQEGVEESWRGFEPRDGTVKAALEPETVEPMHKFPEDLIRRIDNLRRSREPQQERQQHQSNQPHGENIQQRPSPGTQAVFDYDPLVSMRDPYGATGRFIPRMPNMNVYTSPLNLHQDLNFDAFPPSSFLPPSTYQTYDQHEYDMPLNSYPHEEAQPLPLYGQHAGWFESTTFQTNNPADRTTQDQSHHRKNSPHRRSAQKIPRQSRKSSHQPTEAQLAALSDEEILSGAIDPKYIVGPLILRLAMRYTNTEIAERCNAQLAKPLSSNLYTKRITKALKDAHGYDQETYDRVRKEFDAKRKRNGVNINMSRTTGAFDLDGLGRRRVSREEMVGRMDGYHSSRRGGMDEPASVGGELEGRSLRPRGKKDSLPDGCNDEPELKYGGMGYDEKGEIEEGRDEDFKQSL